MGFLERIEERRKKERADLRAKEREEQRQEEMHEQEREQKRLEEGRRIERELQEAEHKSQEKSAAFHARYIAERRAERLRLERIIDNKRELSEAQKDNVRLEAREAKLRELRRQEIRDSQRLKAYEVEQTRERKAKLVEERKEMALLDAKRTEYQERRRQEHSKASQIEINNAKQPQEHKVRQSESRNKITHSEARQVKLNDRRRYEKLEKRGEKRENSARIGNRQSKRPAGQRFPSGRLSGSLPWLHVQGKYLLDEMNQVVALRGVTANGLERAQPVDQLFHRPLDDVDFTTFQDWGVTALVVPIAQDLALEGRDIAEGEDYLEALDSTIQAAADVGIYTIIRLSLISSLLPTGVRSEIEIFDPALPDQRSIDLWAVLARRYSNEPAVIFDVFRTPHDPEPGDSISFLLPRFSWSVWRHWLFAMLAEIRREHPRAVVIARGLNYDMSGFPLTYSDGSQPSNVIYATEIAPSNTQQVLVEIKKINRAGCVCLLDVRTGPFDSRFVEALGRILAREGIHWISADWKDGKTQLVEQRLGRHIATPVGRAFQVALHAPLAPETNFEPKLLMVPSL